jgi:hypothetical protein
VNEEMIFNFCVWHKTEAGHQKVLSVFQGMIMFFAGQGLQN